VSLVGYYRDLLNPMVEGRNLILAGVPLAGANRKVVNPAISETQECS
jgi:hypothetical protein